MRCASQNLVWLNARARTKEKPKLMEGQSKQYALVVWEFEKLWGEIMMLRRWN